MNAIDLMRRSIDMAQDVSTRAFLNSLMREWHGWTLEDGGDGRLFVRFPLPHRGGHVAIEMTHRSRAAYHSFRAPFLEFTGGPAPRPISFQEFAFLLACEPDIVGSADRDKSLTFLARVLDSVRNVEDVVARAPSPDALFAERDPGFAEAEGSLRFGHAVHPTPRSRDQFTLEDSRRFAPEYRQEFALRWWAADPALVLQDSSRAESAADLLRTLATGDALMPREILDGAKGRVLLPMHPWQAARLTLDPAIDTLFRQGRLRDLGHAGSPWLATSSLRAIHASHADWMLKFSLSLRLTNSRRIIETRECERGIEIDRLLSGEIGRTIARRFPSFKVMGEPAYLLLTDAAGRPLPQTTVILRENPFKGERQPPGAVLAALCEIGPDGRGSALATLVHRIAARQAADPGAVASRWFRQFLDRIVSPFLLIQADIGLLFGAHQQNIVVELADGWPEAVHFRDCQGTGYIREFKPALTKAAQGSALSAGHVFNTDEAAQLVGYYLIINSVFAVIGALGISRLVAEETLVGDLRAFLQELAALPLADKTCLTYLLNAPTLVSKGNFMICFRDINENTDVVNPLAGYVPLPNPISEVAA